MSEKSFGEQCQKAIEKRWPELASYNFVYIIEELLSFKRNAGVAGTQGDAPKGALEYIKFQSERWSYAGDTMGLRGVMQDFVRICEKSLSASAQDTSEVIE